MQLSNQGHIDTRDSNGPVLDPAAQYHQNRYAMLLDRAVFPGCNWLDIGAGRRIHGGWLGTTQADLTHRASRFAGCDPHAEHLFQNPHLTERYTCPADDLPFEEQSFDLVTANMVLEHLADPVTVFCEISRVLVPGGLFIFVTPNKHHPIVSVVRWTLHSSWRQKLAAALERRKPEDIFPTLYRANTPRDITRSAERAGLLVTAMEQFSSLPFTQKIPVLHWLEQAWIACCRWDGLARYRSNLLGVLVNLAKPAAAPALRIVA